MKPLLACMYICIRLLAYAAAYHGEGYLFQFISIMVLQSQIQDDRSIHPPLFLIYLR